MGGDQLPLFQRKTYKGIILGITLDVCLPVGGMTVLETLAAYYTYLKEGGFSQYTPDDFTGDLKKFGVFLKEKQIKDIGVKDIQAWILFLKIQVRKGRD